jgi:hypothetical protein
MDPKIADLLNTIPDNPPRSKLEPHSDVIAALRKKRYTYRQISQFLSEHLQVNAAPSTIHDFLRVRRSRARKLRTPVVERRPKAEPVTTPVPRPTQAVGDVKKRIAAFKNRSGKDGETKPRFVYDEAEPLQLREPGSGNENEQKN